MTLKQFGKAAGGIILALLLNATKLVVILKWPLMFILAGGGLAMAFVPFQDRPLETWALSFIRSIYAPTIYLWKKRANKNWLDIDLSKKLESDEDKEEEEIPRKDENRVDEFIESLPSQGQKLKIKDQKGETILAESLKPKAKSEVSAEAKTLADKREAEEDWRGKKTDLNLKTSKLGATGTAVFGSIPMPDTPDIPNVLVGMVTDINGRIVEGAIIEIQDAEGNPSRVLKTNPLGQFRTSTQLANGMYLIITEKEGFTFDRVDVSLTGKIMEPIKIQAKA